MTASTEVTNQNRAAWANASLYLFGQLTGTDHEDALGDLLCDLMHWSDQYDFDFTAALDRARGHYEAELLAEDSSLPDRPRNAVSDIIAALKQAVAALNTAPRFAVPSLDTDSYRIASACDRALALAQEAGQ